MTLERNEQNKKLSFYEISMLFGKNFKKTLRYLFAWG